MVKVRVLSLYPKLALTTSQFLAAFLPFADALVESLEKVWLMFYTEVMPVMQIIMKPVRVRIKILYITIIIVCAYIVLYRPLGKTLSALLTILSHLLTVSSISGPRLGLYLSAAIAAHIQICQSTCHTGPLIFLESEPVMCSDRESNPGPLRGNQEH